MALTDTKSGADVIEYGVRTAIAIADIVKGDYVHTHYFNNVMKTDIDVFPNTGVGSVVEQSA